MNELIGRRSQKLSRVIAACCAGLIFGCAAPTVSFNGDAYVNGRWYDGENFVDKTVYVADGRFVKRAPTTIDNLIDLEGGYVIPPLAETHIHALNQAAVIDEQILQNLDKGVFYVMVQDAIYEITPNILAKLNRPDSLDVTYAQCVVTPSTYVVVAFVYQNMGEQGAFGGEPKTLEELDGKNVCIVNSMDDLERKWDLIASKNDNFIKTLVGFTEEQDERKADPTMIQSGRGPGLDPKILDRLVEKAHAAGLRVSVHIDTAADFRRAIESKADIIAHFPGWRLGAMAGFQAGDTEPFKISPEDAAMAARSGTVTLTTMTPRLGLPGAESEMIPYWEEVNKHNLRVLVDAGASIAIGSDGFGGYALENELNYIRLLGILDDPAILKLAVEDSAQIIFPNRKIGKLAVDYEASFLVLESNPNENLDHLRNIRLRVKNGRRVLD